jgi:ribosomal protein S13
MKTNKNKMKTDLTTIPGIGERMAEHLIKAGYPDIASLKNVSPDEVYAKDCIAQGMQVDRCALYQYRLAVAFASGGITAPEQCKWWNWKD